MSERPAAAQRVSSDPPESVNQAAAQPVPTRPDEAAPGSGNAARTDPQSPTLAGAGVRSAAPGTPTSGRAPGALPVTEAGPVQGEAELAGVVAEPPDAPERQAESLMSRPQEVQVPSTAAAPVPVDGPHQVPNSDAASLARRSSAPDGEVAPD
jgi:hypothetical protein